MIPVMCIVQDGQVPPLSEAVLRTKINAFTERAFHEQADIDWIVTPSGRVFTVSRPTTPIIISLCANAPLETGIRVSLLKILRALCREATGCAAHEVVIAIRDPR